MSVFEERGKPEYPEKNLSVQSREQTNSTHIWRWIWESNLGHSGGRWVLSPLRQPYTPRNQTYVSVETRDTGRFPFTKKFRKFRLGCKWNTHFWFVALENFRNKRNFWKGSPVFPLETFRWKCVFHLQLLKGLTTSRVFTATFLNFDA